MYDASAEMALWGYLFSDIISGYDVSLYLGDFLAGHEMESDTCYDLADTLLIIAAFCKFISYDSIYEIMYCLKDKKALFNIAKRVLSSDIFVKIQFQDEGETVRYVYALSDKGLKRAATLIPKTLQPDDLESRKLRKIKNSGSYIAHDYYCGMNFLRLLFSGYLLQYKREIVFEGANAQDSSRFSNRKGWAFRTAGTIRTDAFAYFLNFTDKDPRSIFYIEQDTGTEDAETVLLKLGEYYAASYIGYSSSHNLVFSYRERMKGFIDNYFPYMFNKELASNVCSFMLHYNCDLYSLIYRFCFSDDIYQKNILAFKKENRNYIMENVGIVGYNNNSNMVGSVSVNDFLAVCNYAGKIPYETLYMTAICAQSIFRLFSLPGIEQVFGLINSDDRTATMRNSMLDAVRDKLSSCKIDINLMQDYVKCCQELLCMNPFYIFLKESFCYSRCAVRKNKILTHLMKPFRVSKTPSISSYHFAMISGAEAFYIPTMHIGTYAYSLMPRHMATASHMLSILKHYYSNISFVSEYSEAFATSPEYPDLFLRNFYRYSFGDNGGVYGVIGKDYSGEVYVEHTCASLSALFRTRFFLEKYCGLKTEGRHVTIVCLVNSFNDAVNTALFLNSWKYIDMTGITSNKGNGIKEIDICTHDVEVCFCLYSDLMKNGLDLDYLFYVVKDEDKSEAIKGQIKKENVMYNKSNLEDGMYIPDFLKGNGETKEESDVNINKGSGYGNKQGIVHSSPDGQCKGFRKVPVYAPFK